MKRPSMDRTFVLASGAYARVLVERRCRHCGMWLSGSDVGHSSLQRLMAGGRAICTDKGTGRARVRVFTAMPTEKQREQIERAYVGNPEFHPLLAWQLATVPEKAEAMAKVK